MAVINAPDADLPESHARDRGYFYRRHWSKDENRKRAVEIGQLEKIRRERRADYHDIAQE